MLFVNICRRHVCLGLFENTGQIEMRLTAVYPLSPTPEDQWIDTDGSGRVLGFCQGEHDTVLKLHTRREIVSFNHQGGEEYLLLLDDGKFVRTSNVELIWAESSVIYILAEFHTIRFTNVHNKTPWGRKSMLNSETN